MRWAESSVVTMVGSKAHLKAVKMDQTRVESLAEMMAATMVLMRDRMKVDLTVVMRVARSVEKMD